MPTFSNYQSALEKLIHELITLNDQFLKASKENSLAAGRELIEKMRKVRQQIRELRAKGTESKKPDVTYKSFHSTEPNTNEDLHIDELQIIERIEKIYVFLERISMNEAKFFASQDKAALRKARSELQRIRLWLYDITGTRPSRHSNDD